MKPLAILVVLLGLVACSGRDDAGEASPDRGRPTTSVPRTGEPAPPTDLNLADTDVCALVRQGIDAFNLGDLEGTIAKFEDAIGPAEDLAGEQPSDQTRTLLDAVRYYAALSAAEYAAANQFSPEFARFKDFTLTECAYDGPPGGAATPSEPAIPA